MLKADHNKNESDHINVTNKITLTRDNYNAFTNSNDFNVNINKPLLFLKCPKLIW